LLKAQFCRDAPTVASQGSEGDLGADDFVCVFVSEYLDKYFLSVFKIAPTYLIDEDFWFGHNFTPIVGTSTIGDRCPLLGDFAEHSLKGLFYKGWRVCHSRRDLNMNPVATRGSVNCWLRVFAPRLSSALPAASETLWKVIKDALKTERVRVGGNDVNERDRSFAVRFRLLV
jgi:hypothetical protein